MIIIIIRVEIWPAGGGRGGVLRIFRRPSASNRIYHTFYDTRIRYLIVYWNFFFSFLLSTYIYLDFFFSCQMIFMLRFRRRNNLYKAILLTYRPTAIWPFAGKKVNNMLVFAVCAQRIWESWPMSPVIYL